MSAVEPTSPPEVLAAPVTRRDYTPGETVEVWWAHGWRRAAVVNVGASARLAAAMPFLDTTAVILLRLTNPADAGLTRRRGDWDLVVPHGGSVLLRPYRSRRPTR